MDKHHHLISNVPLYLPFPGFVLLLWSSICFCINWFMTSGPPYINVKSNSTLLWCLRQNTDQKGMQKPNKLFSSFPFPSKLCFLISFFVKWHVSWKTIFWDNQSEALNCLTIPRDLMLPCCHWWVCELYVLVYKKVCVCVFVCVHVSKRAIFP